jgi:hypothetical protein
MTLRAPERLAAYSLGLVCAGLVTAGDASANNSISLTYEYKSAEKVYESRANDFASEKELKNAIKNWFAECQCPNCKGRKLRGDRVIVTIGKVRVYEQVKQPKLFGGTKYVDRHVKDSWRLYDAFLKPASIFKGYIKCTNCNWEIKAGSDIRWLSINDIIHGRF